MDQSTGTSADFKPTLLFFYGTLRIPSVLKRILNLSEDPILTPAEIAGYKIKLWGPYPALVECEDPAAEDSVPIAGSTYNVTTQAHLQRLNTYEGANYTLESIFLHEISPETGERVAKEGNIYVWNGLPDILKDGVFKPEFFEKK
ncbi:hypothetical protein EYR41_003012 [Orbilia oligospora]|uniref:Putative gamma-glutamylcyclotransferase n=1 Tax=Orbilia oligospora TaxID=2813651 RepID=A0A8H2E5U9_ORBOL|nr:hypothetical protein EYR41_003012 [Orbilia oligospora]